MIGLSRTVFKAGTSLVLVFASSLAAMAGPIDLLPGRWSGWGKLTMDGGETEKVKCVATYFRGATGGQLRHNLRCASTNYTIDSIDKLLVVSGNVSGSWEERKYSAGGAVSGKVVGDGINVRIASDTFTARMKIETTKCRQTMNIAPKGMGVSKIAVRLSKC